VIQPTTAPGRTPATRPDRSEPTAFVVDLALVTLFVLLGRASHREGGAVTGFLVTAWPFLTGTGLGWLVVVLARRAGRRLPGRGTAAGLIVLAATVAAGMVLRRTFTDGGTPISFLLVASSLLAVFLLGWRALVRVRGRSRGA
jgi:hypothetical protein